jgi:integrase
VNGRRGNNEGSIFYSKERGWTALIPMANGKRRWVRSKTRSEVARQLNTALKAMADGLPPSASNRLTVGAYLEEWILGARGTIRPNTHRRYVISVKQLTLLLGSIPLARLSAADVSTALAAMMANGSAARTAIAARSVLGRALREAEAAGLVARNVARLARPPRAPSVEMKTLTSAQARTLLKFAEGDRLAALYHVALTTGARQGELLALRWQDVDFDAGVMRIRRTLMHSGGGLTFAEPKTRASRRAVLLGPSAVDALRRHRVTQATERMRRGSLWQDHDLVFPSAVGTPLDGGNLLQNTHYPLPMRAGLPRLRFHDMRHTAATLMLEQGVHPKVVAERLGHATVNVTLNVYSHVTPTMQRDAATTLDRLLGGA